MNFWCISTIICVIVIMALVFVNLLEAYVTEKHQSKLQQLLNEFRNEANKTTMDLEILENMVRHNSDHGRRQRRQALDLFSNFPEGSNNENVEEEGMVPYFNLDICKDGNCGSKIGYSDRSKYSLKPSEELHNLLAALKKEQKKGPREISLFKSGTNNEEENRWKNVEEEENLVKEENKAENEVAERQKSFKVKSKGKNGLKSKKFSWAQNEKQHKFNAADNLQQNSNFFNDHITDGSNSDISACQHCSQHEDNLVFSNNYKSYKDKPIDNYENKSKNPKISKQPKKLAKQQPFLNSFEQKYSIESQQNDDEDDMEDDLYQIKLPSVILTRTQQENENQRNDCNSTALDINKESKNHALNVSHHNLNDQFENTKNNLSHEANYKLSKNEQDDSENKKDFSWKWSIFKRSYPFNAMNEIKLKTSRRLMKKGFGASLPSYSLGETRREIMIDNMLRRREKEMLEEKNRKYKNFDEPIENDVRQTDKEVGDFADMPTKALSATHDLKNWTLSRRKRISDLNNRYKRELNEISYHNGSKALDRNLSLFKHASNIPKNALKATSQFLKISSGTDKALKSKTNKTKNYLKAFKVDGTTKMQNRGHKYKDIEYNTQKALNLAGPLGNQPNEHKLISFLDNENKNNHHRLHSQNLAGACPDLKNSMKASKEQNYELLNYKPVTRRKRSIQREIFAKQSMNNENQKLSLNKLEINGKLGELNKTSKTQYKSSVKAVSKHARTFKVLKRIKRFNPSKALELQIYKKFHSPKALRNSTLKGLPNKKYIKAERIREKRSLKSHFFMAKNSAGNENLISVVTKKLLQKAQHIKKNLKDFVKKSMTYLQFRKSFTKSSGDLHDSATKGSATASYKALSSDKTEPRAFDIPMSYEKNETALQQNQTLPQEKAVNETGILKSVNKIRNPKLRFLKDIVSNFFLFQQDFKNYNETYIKELYKPRAKRAVKILKPLTEKYLPNENNTIISVKSDDFEDFLNNPESFLSKTSNNDLHKGSFDVLLNKTEAKISFFINFLNSKPLNRVKHYLNYTKSLFQTINSTNTAKSSPKKLLISSQLSGKIYNNHHYATKSSLKFPPAINCLSLELSGASKNISYNHSEVNVAGESLKRYSNDNSSIITKIKKKHVNEKKPDKAFDLMKGFDLSKQLENKNLGIKLFDVKALTKFNESCIYKQGQKKLSRLNESLALNKLQIKKQDFEKEYLKRLETKLHPFPRFNENCEQKNLSDQKSSFKNQPKEIVRRLKRSLGGGLPEDRFKADNFKHLNKRSYFFHHGDLYTPDCDTDSYKNPKNRENYLNEPQQMFGNEVWPTNQERVKLNNFEDNHKIFYPEELNNLKTRDPTTQKFGGTKFENLWLDNKSGKENAKRQRTNFKHQISQMQPRNLKNTFKRQNSDYLKRFVAQNKTIQIELKSTTTKPSKTKIFKDQYLSDLTDFNNNYKFNENIFNWPKDKLKTHINLNNNSMNDSEKLSLELRNEILNCKAFASLEEFIKSLPKNLTHSLLGGKTESNLNSFTEKNEMDINTSVAGTEALSTAEPSVSGSTIKCSTTTESEENVDEHTETSMEPTEDVYQPADMDFEQSTETGSQDDDTDVSSTDSVLENVTAEYELPTNVNDQDCVRLNISINANVHGNPKNNHYRGNGSFNVIPGIMDDRRRRHIFHSPLGKIQRRAFQQKKNDVEDNEEELNDLMSGKLSSKLVSNILNTVQESAHLKALWPSLQRDRPLENTQQTNFYAIRNQQTEKQLQNSEKLLDRVMSSINSIIEQQARSQACVPLRPDLQEFYKTILQSRQQQDMLREKHHLIKQSKQSKDFGYKIQSLDPTEIEEETKIVKKLLKKYDELPQEDQQQVAVAHDDLVKNLIILRQLQDSEEQQKLDSREKREHAWDVSDEEIMKSLQSQYSPQYLKLLNAAKLYKEINSD